MSHVDTPDIYARGLLDEAPKAARYENCSMDPSDVGPKISGFIPHGARVLDVGCGTGSISEVIQRLTGADLIGVEPDRDRLEIAVSRGINAYHGILSPDFIQSNGKFDAIVFADVLEHLPDPAAVVLLAKEALKPDGVVIASVPNVAHFFVRLDMLRGKFEYRDCGIMDATHLRWFTKLSLVAFFDRLGFTAANYTTTVNIELSDYQNRLPWRWLRKSGRRKVVGFLVDRFPTLFGCQHIIVVKLAK
jgi:SAM-dependent methyltransferase